MRSKEYYKLKIANELRQIRKEMRITQTEMSRRLDVSQPAYSKQEVGKSSLPMTAIVKLMDLLNDLPSLIPLATHIVMAYEHRFSCVLRDGYTQKDLADKSGMWPPLVSRYIKASKEERIYGFSDRLLSIAKGIKFIRAGMDTAGKDLLFNSSKCNKSTEANHEFYILIEYLGLSRSEMGEKIGVSKSVVQSIVKGNSRLKPELARILMKEFGDYILISKKNQHRFRTIIKLAKYGEAVKDEN